MKDTSHKIPVYKFSSFTEDMAAAAFNLEQELEAEGYLTDWLQQANQENIKDDELKQLEYLACFICPKK